MRGWSLGRGRAVRLAYWVVGKEMGRTLVIGLGGWGVVVEG